MPVKPARAGETPRAFEIPSTLPFYDVYVHGESLTDDLLKAEYDRIAAALAFLSGEEAEPAGPTYSEFLNMTEDEKAEYSAEAYNKAQRVHLGLDTDVPDVPDVPSQKPDYNMALGRQLVYEIAIRINDALWPEGGGPTPRQLVSQVAQQILNLPPPDEINYLGMTPEVMAITQYVSREQQVLRIFPDTPLLQHQRRQFIDVAESEGVITADHANALRYPNARVDPDIAQEAAEWFEQGEEKLQDVIRNLTVGAGGKKQSLFTSMTRMSQSDQDLFPAIGMTAAEARAEEAAEVALAEYEPGNEKKLVRNALVGARIDVSAAGLSEEDKKVYKAAFDKIVFDVEKTAINLSTKRPDLEPEHRQQLLKDYINELVGDWDQTLLVTANQKQRELDEKAEATARDNPGPAVEKHIASLGLDPADVSDRGKKTMRDDVRISGPSVLAGYPAESVELFIREKSNEDFLAEGDDAIMGVLGRLGIGDAFNLPFQEHIQETVLPQLKPYLEEQFKRDPFFNREAFIGTLLGVAPLEPGAGFDLRGAAAAPGEAFIPLPGAAPDALARYKDDAARFPKPLISFDAPVYWDPEQYAAGVDPTQPPAPPPTLANVFESITRGQGGAFIPPGPLDVPVDGIPGQGTYPFDLQGAGGAPGEVFIPPLDHRGIVPREPTGFAPIPTQRRTSLGPAYGTTEGLEFTGLERPGEVPDVFPTFANTGFVQAAPLGFQFDPDIPLSPGQFRVDMPDLSQMAFDIAEGDPAYLRFLLAKESPFRLALGEFPEFAEEEAGRRETEANERLLALWEKGAAGLGTGRGREALFETMLDRRSPIEAAPFFEERAPGFRSAFEITPAFEEARLQKVETEEREMAAEQRRRLRRGRTVIV